MKLFAVIVKILFFFLLMENREKSVKVGSVANQSSTNGGFRGLFFTMVINFHIHKKTKMTELMKIWQLIGFTI